MPEETMKLWEEPVVIAEAAKTALELAQKLTDVTCRMKDALTNFKRKYIDVKINSGANVASDDQPGAAVRDWEAQ